MDAYQHILLVEDDKVDQMTIKRCLKDINSPHPLHICENGEEAIHYLKSCGGKLPGFILLDLNMPRMNGIEFLHAVKADETLRKIPIIVLTTSQEESDRSASFNLSAAGYMLKPVEYSEFAATIRTVQEYWRKSEVALA